MNELNLTPSDKKHLRMALILESSKLLGVKYEFGAEWTDLSKTPESIDCSEMIEGVYHICGLTMPDGSQNQYNYIFKIDTPMAGDLAFFGKSGDSSKIYHVGIVYDEENIIEARGFDPLAKFKTGEVILRGKRFWEAYKNFCGYGVHKSLI